MELSHVNQKKNQQAIHMVHNMTINCTYLCNMTTLITKDISKVAEALRQGLTAGIPTETVYGLAANGLNEVAISSIFSIKGRPTSNPLILHFYDLEQARPFMQEFHEELHLLEQKFCPGPITFLVSKSPMVPAIITAGLPRVAVRFPSHPMLRNLLSELDFPLAAPSANKYGAVSPTQAMQVKAQLNGMIPFVLDGGPCSYGIESTIVGIENEKVIIYRLGSIPLDEISVILGYMPAIKNHSSVTPLAPGMVKYHYAPNTPLQYFNASVRAKEGVGYLFFNNIPEGFPHQQCTVLSQEGDLREVARNLYQSLIEMDGKGFKELYIERPKPEGMGLTLLDRLDRATAKFE